MNRQFHILAFAALAILAFGCGKEQTKDNGGEEIEIHEDNWQKYPTTGQVKVMSFNVRYGTASETNPYNNWDFRKDACLAMIKDQKPSVIGFQEAVYDIQWSWFKEQLADEYDGYGVGRDDGKEKGETMGILYRKSEVKLIGEMQTFWLSASPDTPSKATSWDSSTSHFRSATVGIFEVIATGKRFCYINTHLDLVAKVRTESMKLIAERFKMYNPEGYAEFLTADFNTQASDTIFNVITDDMGNAKSDAPQGHTDNLGTYNNWGDSAGKVIDMIWYSRTGSTVAEYHCVTDGYLSTSYISDHYPIYGIFTLK